LGKLHRIGNQIGSAGTMTLLSEVDRALRSFSGELKSCGGGSAIANSDPANSN
jgi:hypothetical protein